MNLSPKFTASLIDNIGETEATALIEALDTPATTSIRFNPYKIGEKPVGRNVPWSKYGFYLDERPIFTADPLFHGGAYYVQEASSMFIEQFFVQLFDGDSQLKVLDLCAAPGGKTTHISSLVGLDSLVVANETIRSRANILSENVQKWGLGNVVVTNNDPSNFRSLESFFDVVVVDAPCSGEGMFRKNIEARGEWSPNNVTLCASRQQRILSDVWGSLKEGGILVYSTCTFNRTENEENIAWLCQNFDCEVVHIETDPAWGIVRGEVEGIETFRFYPQRTVGEGFFAAVLRKGGIPSKRHQSKTRKGTVVDLPKKDLEVVAPWCAQSDFMRFGIVNNQRIFGYYSDIYPYINLLVEHLSVIYSGVEIGQVIGGKVKPEQSLALFHDIERGIVNETNLELFDALKYLRKDDTSVDLYEEGLNLVCYNGLPLGFIKRIGARCNNMYPKEWRILNIKGLE